MRKFIALVALVLSMPGLAAGDDMTDQERNAKAILYVDSIRATVLQLNEANKMGLEVVTEIERFRDRIDNEWVALENAFVEHNKDGAEQNAFAREVTAEVDSYNRTCRVGISDKAYNWCQKHLVRFLEPSRGEAVTWAFQVDENRARLNKNRVMLELAGTSANSEYDELLRKSQEYFKTYNLLVGSVKEFSAGLNQLQIGYDACKKARGMMGKVHEICGSMFDGDIVHETETNYPVPDLVAFNRIVSAERCTPQKYFCYSHSHIKEQ
jgi:hypothetical protein